MTSMKSNMSKNFATKSKLRCATGGMVRGPGGPTDDKVPALLSNGEYVLPAKTVQAVGKDKLDGLVQNSQGGGNRATPRTASGLRKMAHGGYVVSEIEDIIPEEAKPRPGDPLTSHKLRVAAQQAPLEGELIRAAKPPVGPGGNMGPRTGRLYTPPPADPVEALKARVAPAAKPSVLRRGAGALGKAAGVLGGVLEAGSGAIDASRNGLGVANAADMAAGGATVFGSLSASPLAPVALAGGVGYSAGKLINDFLPSSDAIGGTMNQMLGGADDRFTNVGAGARTTPLRGPVPQARTPYVSPYANSIPGEASIIPPDRRTGAPGEVLGTFNGRPITRSQSDALSSGTSFGGYAPPAASPLRAQVGEFTGGPSIDTRGINSRFDALAKEIKGLHGSSRFAARGELGDKLLQIESARAQALGQAAGTDASVYGSNVSANSSMANNARSVEAQMFGDQLAANSKNVDTALRAQLDGRKAQQEELVRREEGFNKLATELFPMDKEGAALNGFRPDEVLDFIATKNPEFEDGEGRSYYDLSRSEQANFLLEASRVMARARDQDSRRDFFSNSDPYGTPTGEVYDEDTDLSDAWHMWKNGDVSIGSIARHIINPFASDKVERLDNGRLGYTDDIYSGSEDENRALRAWAEASKARAAKKKRNREAK
jgi:hypothetical protein